ncbi:MAG TPA: WD40 repeat domain-containing protein, partial [Anaerolineales bacterium]|nr:WD40 repeat domain-containing protein [Anaerolineales bacterium]
MHPDFSRLVRQHTEAIVPLTSEELSRAISGPARQVGISLEEGLVAQIVAEVNEQPGGLPLLQYALTELFERRDGRLLTRDAYREIGGVTGALGRRAEEIYQQLEPAGQEAARQVFLRLVTLGEGVEDTRRRVLRSELEGLEGLGDRGKGFVEAVLEAFGKARLLSFDRDPLTRGPTVEVAHEALLREWPRLRAWLDEGREGLRRQRQLGQLETDWRRSGEDASYLLRGSRLELFESWAAETDLALTGDEQAYLQASLAERKSRREGEATRQAHEAALELRSRRFLRALVGVFAVAAVVAVLLSLFAFNQQRLARENEVVAKQNALAADQNAATAVAARGEAEQLADLRSREAQVNQSLALAAQSRLALQANNLDLALALAREAVNIPDPPGQAQVALSEAAYAPGTIRVFLGHAAPVWSVAVSPDGRYGLSGDADGVIFLRDLETGEALRRLEGHQGRVSSLAFTPDGRHAVSGSHDMTLVYWDLETGEIMRRLEGHQYRVNTVAISPDGRLAASGSGRPDTELPYSTEDNSVRLWDLQSGKEIRRFEFFTDGVTGLDFTPDGRGLAVATVSDGFVLLDVETKKILVRPEVFWLDMAEVVVSPDGLLALTPPYNKVAVLDLQTGEVARELAGHNSNVYGLAISPDGQRALGGSNTLIEWDLGTGEEIQRFAWGANAIAYLPGGKAALIGSDDHTVRLLGLGPGAEIGHLLDGQCWIRSVVYSPDGRTALTSDDCSLSLWDLETGNILWSESPGFDEVAFSADGKQVLASELEFATLRDAETGKVLVRLESDGSFESQSGINAVSFHPSGKYALTGAQHGTRLIYWDLETGKPVWLADRDNNVLGVAISPDGRSALSAEWDGVNWWDLETGQLLKHLQGHTNIAWGVAFVDERTAISTSDDRTLILWDLESGTALRTFLGHTDGVKRVALSPDKRLALSASRDGTAILWDLQTDEALRRYAGHEDQIRTVAFHPNGEEALTGGQDNQAIRWRIDADLDTFLEWIDQNRYVRALTCTEREVFHAEPLCTTEESAAESAAAEEPAETAAAVAVTGEALLPPLPVPTPLPRSPETVPAASEKAGTAVRGANLGSIPTGGGQVWDYAGTAGETLSIRAAAPGQADAVWSIVRRRELGLLDTTLTIYAPDGTVLAQAEDLENGVATDAYLASLTLPESGPYRIEVRSYRDESGGDYRLVLAEPRSLVFDLKLPTTAG